MALRNGIQRGYVGKKGSDFESQAKKTGDEFFENYRACVLTLRNAPE